MPSDKHKCYSTQAELLSGVAATDLPKGNESSHDIGRNDSFVVFPPCDFTQVQQVSDDRHQEPVLLFLQHGPTDGPNSPTKGVETIPGQLSPILELRLQAAAATGDRQGAYAYSCCDVSTCEDMSIASRVDASAAS